MTGRKSPANSSMLLAAPEHDVAYYTISDASYFLGTVGLLNSLRRVGDQAPLFVVDCGLTAEQRALLSTHATIVPRHEELHPLLQKTTGPLLHPAKIMVFIDADMLVTRPLSPLFSDAQAGRIVAFADSNAPDRFFDAWSSPELGQARRRTYVNGGFLAFSWDTAREFLPLFYELQRDVDLTRTHIGGGSPSHPLYFLDQDVLNALYCTRFDGRVTRLEGRLAPFPPFSGVELTDGDRTLCRYADGVAPFALHHINRKPWLVPLPANAYSRLFTRLVTDRQACLPLGPAELPRRLSNRPLARLDRTRIRAEHVVNHRLLSKVAIRPRIPGFGARLAG